MVPMRGTAPSHPLNPGNPWDVTHLFQLSFLCCNSHNLCLRCTHSASSWLIPPNIILLKSSTNRYIKLPLWLDPLSSDIPSHPFVSSRHLELHHLWELKYSFLTIYLMFHYPFLPSFPFPAAIGWLARIPWSFLLTRERIENIPGEVCC